MSSRDLWSVNSKDSLRDLLADALAALLIHPEDERAVYFSSPWMSDFLLFENPFRQYDALFSEELQEPQIWFTMYLETLSRKRPVRIVTVKENQGSKKFVVNKRLKQTNRVEIRSAPPQYHEKGILTPFFYLEGSMNITFHGVNIRNEKIVFHVPDDPTGIEKIARAYIEFDRFWQSLQGASV